MKIVRYSPPEKPTKQEKKQKLGDLEISDCFRFYDETSYDDALKTHGQSFFFVTEPCGSKPPEGKVPCMSFDMRSYRILDGDRMVIKHDVRASIAPATMIDIPAVAVLSDNSDRS